MASRWQDAGFSVLAYDLDSAGAADIAARGGQWAASLQEVAASRGPLVLSLPDSQAVTTVMEGLESDLAPGHIVIDTTTGTPETTEALAHRLAQRGVVWLDATVAGSSQQVLQGEAVMLVGGDQPSFVQHRFVFDAVASEVFWLGPSGSGARMKLVVNLALGLHRAVLAESLALAHGLGFDLQQTLDVLKATPAYSRAMDTKGPKMVGRDFTPQARLKQHLKDVHLILAAGRRHGQALPLSELHRQILEGAVERGDGDLDNSAVIRSWLGRGWRS